MRKVVLALVVSGLLGGHVLGAPAALAHGGAGGEQLPPDADPVAPDGVKAKERLASLPSDDTTKALVEAPVKKARLALGRAHGAKLAGDEEGAGLLSRVALGWADSAVALVSAALSETKAAEAETKTKDLKDKLGRARALLAETEARKLQLVASVKKAEEAAKAPPVSVDPAKKKAGEVAKPSEKKGQPVAPKKPPEKAVEPSKGAAPKKPAPPKEKK
ncbi:MAG: hypothetical protein IPM79_15410 [Polyangiaceae bacterium]|nr:hypothetical protein [Polyangiaceae bacterium]